MRDVHWCVTVDYQPIAKYIANQIHGFTIDYGKFILIRFNRWYLFLKELAVTVICENAKVRALIIIVKHKNTGSLIHIEGS